MGQGTGEDLDPQDRRPDGKRLHPRCKDRSWLIPCPPVLIPARIGDQKGNLVKNRICLIALAVAALAIFAAPVSAAAQARGGVAKKKVDMNAPAPRLPNGKPDFRGTWG